MAADKRKQLKRRDKPSIRERNQAKLYKCEQVVEQFCQYVREGLPPTQCCYLVGLNPLHYRRMEDSSADYVEKGRIPDGVTVECLEKWADFFEHVYQAMAQFQLDHIRHALSIKSSREDRFMWARSMAILERRDPDNWRLKKEVEITKRDFDKDESFL